MSAEGGGSTVDDDEELLVREVIAENPVEERGVRDEWAGKVGWHDKVDVHNRLRKQDVHQEIVLPNGSVLRRPVDGGVAQTSSVSKVLWLVVLVGIAVALRMGKKKQRSV